MTAKAKRKVRKKGNPQNLRRVHNAGFHMADEEHWQTTATVLLVERRTCRCGVTYECPSPQLMVKQRSDRYKRAERIAPLSPRIKHPDPLLPQYITHIDVPIPRCPMCFVERNGQGELFPERRYLGVQGQRPPSAQDAQSKDKADDKPKVKPIADDYF